jgi:hypothetical protein
VTHSARYWLFSVDEGRNQVLGRERLRIRVCQSGGVTLRLGHCIDAAPVVPRRLGLGSFSGFLHGQARQDVHRMVV